MVLSYRTQEILVRLFECLIVMRENLLNRIFHLVYHIKYIVTLHA